MTVRACVGMTVALVVSVTAVPATAQALGELAKKEAERRGSVRSPGRVYSNDNLIPDYTTPPRPAVETGPEAGAEEPPERVARTRAAAAAAAAAREAGSPMPDPEQAEGVTPPDEQEPQPASDKGETYWRDRARAIRARLAAQNRQIEALRDRIASFTPGAASPERDVADRALARALEDQRSLQDEWTRFENHARERGIPDAWIR